MKNLRELFSLYHAGFQDFGPWLDHHREMHRHHPLDVPEFGAEWLRRWEAVGKLLEAPTRTYALFEDGWIYVASRPFAPAFRVCVSLNTGDKDVPHYDRPKGRRIVLLDGTIIREWGPK